MDKNEITKETCQETRERTQREIEEEMAAMQQYFESEPEVKVKCIECGKVFISLGETICLMCEGLRFEETEETEYFNYREQLEEKD